MKSLRPLADGWPITLLLAGLLATSAARAEPNHPALRKLLPLIEVYAADETAPPYDVAGLRCAGLLLAQFDWAAKHAGITGPDEAAMAMIDGLFEASEQQRLNDGMDLARAHVSIEREARRVWRLYERRFAANAAASDHPWAEDPLIRGDTSFCRALTKAR